MTVRTYCVVHSMTGADVFLAATKQLYECLSPSVRHTFFTMILSSSHLDIFKSDYQWEKWCSCKRSRSEVKGQCHRGQNQICLYPDCNWNWNPPVAAKWCIMIEWAQKRCPIVFQVIHKISRSQEEEIVRFDPIWRFPHCNSNLNSPMGMKRCIKLEWVLKGCLIVFQGHLWNFKVTGYEIVKFGPNCL